MSRIEAVASAIGLFGVWTLATYLLETRCPQLPRIATAIAAVVVLVSAEVMLFRPPVRVPSRVA